MFNDYGSRVEFLDVFVRQAHPGPRAEAFESYGQKMDAARQYLREEDIPWKILVDDLPGTTHDTYGTMTDPTYLIDTEGRVSYYCMWTYVPHVREAIADLLAQGGKGVVRGGIDRVPHLAAAFVGGWEGVKRGGLRSVLEYEAAVPGSATLTFLGRLARPVLRPVALRSTELPRSARLGMFMGLAAAGTAAAAGIAAFRSRRNR